MRRMLAVCLFLGITAVAVHAVMAGMADDIKSSLSGKVSWTAEQGSAVTPGSEIVRIKTLTGEAAAARAAESGTVEEMLVAVGDEVSAGQVVARVAAEKQ